MKKKFLTIILFLAFVFVVTGCATFKWQTRIGADLIVESFDVTPSDPTTEDYLRTKITIRNKGLLTAPSSTLVIYGDRYPYFPDRVFPRKHFVGPIKIRVPSLARGEFFSFKRVVDPLPAGKYRATAVADGLGEVYEFNENNNSYTIRLKVSAVQNDTELPDFIVDNVAINPINPYTGDTIIISADVKNIGTGASGASTAHIAIGNESSPPAITVPGLGQNGTYTIERSTVFSSTQTVSITVAADVNNAITEADETNNTHTLSLSITECVPQTDPVASLEAASVAIANGSTEIDLDGDCYREYSRIFDAGGNLIREEIDYNDDGTPEMIWDYSNVVKVYTADMNGDGIAEHTEEANVDTANPDIIHITITDDRSGDGIPDYKISFQVDPNAEDIEITHFDDSDQDGNFEEQYTSTTTREQFTGGLSVEKEGAWGCSDTEENQIRDAYNNAIRQGLSCLANINPRLKLEFLLMLARNTIKVYCLDAPGPCGTVDTYKAKWKWLFSFDELPILLGEHNFDGSGECRSLDRTLFHEMLHYVIGPHEHGDGTLDPGDRVRGCEFTCFDANANSQTCAACLGTTNGDSRCNAYPFQQCTGNVPHVCECDDTIYLSETTCAALCPSGLACFWAGCEPLGPCR